MIDRHHNQSHALNLGLAATAALVLAIMGAVVGIAINVAEPDDETEAAATAPAMWSDPPASAGPENARRF